LAVRIRLTRVGATKRPAYRVIAIDKRRSRDGRALEILGYYDPLTEPATVHLDRAKIDAWISKGAQPSETVVKLMRQAEKAASQPEAAEKPKRATRATKPKATKAKAEAKPKPAQEPEAEAQAEPEAAVSPEPEPAAEESDAAASSEQVEA
jgi:small subunit ribosomal protein S16